MKILHQGLARWKSKDGTVDAEDTLLQGEAMVGTVRRGQQLGDNIQIHIGASV